VEAKKMTYSQHLVRYLQEWITEYIDTVYEYELSGPEEDTLAEVLLEFFDSIKMTEKIESYLTQCKKDRLSS
jgi:hypothetical protein